MPKKIENSLEHELLNYEEPITFKESVKRDLSQVQKLGTKLKGTFKVRKVNKKMAKKTKPSRSVRKYAPSRLEVVKTVTIAVLLTSVMAFVAGMNFQKDQQSQVQAAVHTAAAQASK